MIVQPEEIADGPLEGEDITVAVWLILTRRVGGQLAMRAEHLKSWLIEATRDKDPEPIRWYKLVSVPKLAF